MESLPSSQAAPGGIRLEIDFVEENRLGRKRYGAAHRSAGRPCRQTIYLLCLRKGARPRWPLRGISGTHGRDVPLTFLAALRSASAQAALILARKLSTSPRKVSACLPSSSAEASTWLDAAPVSAAA